jgi:hypothetical protein
MYIWFAWIVTRKLSAPVRSLTGLTTSPFRALDHCDPSPTPPATATPTPFRITELQEVLIPNSPEPASPQRTSDDRVRAVLEWTNRVILKTQPTYSAEGLFRTSQAVEQRSQNFRTAREQAILRHSPGK